MSDPARPLALPTPTVYPASSAHDDAEEAAQTATGWRSMQYLRKRRRCVLCCCGCCVTTVVVIGVIILALALTVFKVKEPRLTMNNVWLTAISAGPGSGGIAAPVAYAPAGRVGADRTLRMNVTVDLLADRLARAMNGTGLVFGQEYDLDTYTDINGMVNVLGIIKKDIEIKLNCSVVIEVGGAAAAIESGVASTVKSKGVNCVADVSM